MIQPIRESSGSRPSATFEQPFAMMEACHERVHRMLGLTERLRAHLRAHGSDDQARQAAADVLRYFDQAAPQHHQDEELHVFPPLLAQGDPDTVAVVTRLQGDHLQMEAHWAQVRQVLTKIADGSLAKLTQGQEEALEAFGALYAGHIVAEEEVAYPAAAALLDQAATAAMGQEMAQRRGVR